MWVCVCVLRVQLTGLATGLFLLVVVCLMSIFSLNLLVHVADYLGLGANTSFRGTCPKHTRAPVHVHTLTAVSVHPCPLIYVCTCVCLCLCLCLCVDVCLPPPLSF
jgi:hypothetical protein